MEPTSTTTSSSSNGRIRIPTKGTTYSCVLRRLTILAEALCRMGNDNEAKSALGEIMSRRDSNWSGTLDTLGGNEQTFGTVGTVKTLLDEILLQRRIELWGETGRIFDILGLAKGWTRYWKVNGEESNHTNYLSKYPDYLNFPADYIECIDDTPGGNRQQSKHQSRRPESLCSELMY